MYEGKELEVFGKPSSLPSKYPLPYINLETFRNDIQATVFLAFFRGSLIML